MRRDLVIKTCKNCGEEFNDERRVGRPRKFCSKKCYDDHDYDYQETHQYHAAVRSKEVIKLHDDVYSDNNLPAGFSDIDFIPKRTITYTGKTGKIQSRVVPAINKIGTVTDSAIDKFIRKSKQRVKES